MKQDSSHIFVYGTLRKAFGLPMHQYLVSNGTFIGKASFQGILYEVDNFPGVIASSDPQKQVLGEVYELHDFPAVITELDRYEGYDPDSPEQSFYKRTHKNVYLEDGEFISAWIYIFNRSTEDLEEIKSGDYLQYRRENNFFY